MIYLYIDYFKNFKQICYLEFDKNLEYDRKKFIDIAQVKFQEIFGGLN